jgi:hypothetical protein
VSIHLNSLRMLESYATDSGRSKDRWNEKPQLEWKKRGQLQHNEIHTELAENMDQWWVLVNKILNLWVPHKQGIFVTSWVTVSFSVRFCCMNLVPYTLPCNRDLCCCSGWPKATDKATQRQLFSSTCWNSQWSVHTVCWQSISQESGKSRQYVIFT